MFLQTRQVFKLTVKLKYIFAENSYMAECVFPMYVSSCCFTERWLHGLSVALRLFPVMEWIVSEQFLALSDSPLWAGQPLWVLVLLQEKYAIRKNTKYEIQQSARGRYIRANYHLFRGNLTASNIPRAKRSTAFLLKPNLIFNLKLKL